jgi:predicted transcriptional regulator
MKKKTKRIYTGVTLEPDVIAYLESLGEQEDRDRSWLINAIVREHAKRFSKVKPRKEK